MKYIKNQFIKSSQENSEVINFLFAPKFSYEYKGDNLDDFDNYFTDDVLNIEDISSSLVSIVDKFLSSNTIKLEDKLVEQVSEISVSWNKEDFNLVVSCELSAGVVAEEILPELKEVIIEQVAKNIDSEEVEKQNIFAIKSDDLVEFFSSKGDAEKRAEEIESEDYEVVEGEVTIFVSFDELKSAVVNEKAITSKRKIQSNTVTSTLPPALDTFLKDLAQMKGLFDYEDITDFSKRATDEDLKELKKLRQQANEAAEYDDEEDLERIAKNVSKIILKSSKQIKSSVDTDKLWEIADRYNASKPVSGDWNTETEHELNAISKELGISKQEAKNLMIRELGFDDSMFSGINSSYDTEAVTSHKKIVKSTKVPKNISLDNDTKKLLDKLEKKVGHELEIKFADAEKTVPYVDVEKFKDGEVCVSEGYLDRLSEDLLFDGYSTPVDGFIKVYLNPEIMYTTSVSSSKGSPKTTGKTKDEFIANIEKDLGMKVVDMDERWMTLDDGSNVYDGEWTRYSDGDYELMHYNITNKRAKHVESSKKIQSAKKSEMIYIKNPDTEEWAAHNWQGGKRELFWTSDINDATSFGNPDEARSWPLKGDLYIAEDNPVLGVKLTSIRPYDDDEWRTIKSSFEDEETIDIEDVKEGWANEGYAPDIIADFFDEEELYDGDEITYTQERELFKKFEKYHLSRSAEFSSRKVVKSDFIPKRVRNLLDYLVDNFLLSVQDELEFERNAQEHHFDKLRKLAYELNKADEKDDDVTYKKVIDEIIHLIKVADGDKIQSSLKAIKSEYEETEQTFSNEVSFPSEEYKKWKKEAVKTGVTIVPDYSSDLELAYVGNKHIGTYNTFDEVLWCDDVGLFGHYLENSRQIKSEYVYDYSKLSTVEKLREITELYYPENEDFWEGTVEVVFVEEDEFGIKLAARDSSGPGYERWIYVDKFDDYAVWDKDGNIWRIAKKLYNSKQIKSGYRRNRYNNPDFNNDRIVFDYDVDNTSVDEDIPFASEPIDPSWVGAEEHDEDYYHYRDMGEMYGSGVSSSKEFSSKNSRQIKSSEHTQEEIDFVVDQEMEDWLDKNPDSTDEEYSEARKRAEKYVRRMLGSSKMIKSSTWNDESFAERIVDELNKYADKTYNDADSEFTKKYGKLFNFKYRVEDDGTIVIYDNQGALDLFDEDSSMTEFIRKKCKEMGGYCEPYDSSASFTIAEL